MLFGNPVRSPIHVSAVYYPNDPLAWTRPSGNTDFALTQRFGPTKVAAEPTVVWPGGEGIKAATYSDFHQGIDLGNKGCGAYIKAAAKGTVIAVGIDSAGGHYIKIDHGTIGGYRFVTGYWHEATTLVKVGQSVAEGQNIATVGSTGISSGCHLHWQVWKDGKIVDGWRRLKQNTSVDPDYVAPAPTEADMLLTQYLPLNVLAVSKGYNIRVAPDPAARVIRLTASPEAWSLLGAVKGVAVSGIDKWYVRVNGLTFEYVWSGGLPVPTAPAVVDCTAAVAEATLLQVKLDANRIAGLQAQVDGLALKIAKASADLA